MKNIYNIPANLPFLDSLAKGILEKFSSNPLELANVTIFLPNRRSCRHLRDSFLRISNAKAMILPNMQPMGDVDDEEIFIKNPDCEILPPVVSNTQQRLILARLIQKWQEKLSTHEKANESQATNLAIELANFLNDVEKEQLSLEGLEDIVPEELSSHWQITLKFLHILIDKWPEILSEQNLISIGTHRNLSLNNLCKYWQNNKIDGHIIAAGSTGSIPATRDLLNQIASMQNGTVILAGLDQNIDEQTWQSLDETHPQYTLKQLLDYIEIDKSDIPNWQNETSKNNDLSIFISQMMRPAGTSHKWHEITNLDEAKLNSIEIAHTQTLQEQAVLISLLMKESLNTAGKTTALITNDTELSRHVSAIMKKWEIDIDDSSGKPIAETPQAIFMRLLAKMVENKTSPTDILSCLKHPFASAGLSLFEFRNKIRELEKKSLRGIRNSDGLEGIAKFLKNNNEDALAAIVEKIINILQPFSNIMNMQEANLKELILNHIQVSEKMAETDQILGQERFWASEDGEALKNFLDEAILSAANFDKKINTSEYLGIIEALMVGQNYRVAYGAHPRLFILTPIESRMLRFGKVILGELNEGSWPLSSKSDPWMSRPMRKNFGLPALEKKIGQSAHDFTQILHCNEVVLVRSEKSGGAQTIPSRWLLRMETLMQLLFKKPFNRLDEKWLKWARMLNSTDGFNEIFEPKPSVNLGDFPRKLSVTWIEKLMRNPYEIFANKILYLKKLDPLDQDPGAAEFGNLIHESIDLFLKKYDNLKEEEELNYLLECGKSELAKNNFSRAIEALWWPKFEVLAHEFCLNEKIRRQESKEILSEISGTTEIKINGENFTLTAIADRIEVSPANDLTIIDYKTGTVPTSTDVANGLSPQMTLEGLIANNNGFGKNGTATCLEYWKLSGGNNPIKINNAISSRTKITTQELIDQAQAGITSLLEYFYQEKAIYLACPNPKTAPRYNDYEHLSRIKEWGD